MGVKVREKPPGSGVWWVFINNQGRRKSKRIGDQETAEKVAKEITERLKIGNYSMDEKPKAPVFDEYAEMWLEGYIKPLRRPSTHERYKDILDRYIKPAIGKKPIDEVRRGDIRNLLLEMHKNGYSRSILCLIRDVCSGVMGYAVDDELIPANSVTGIIKRLQLDRERKLAIEPMTAEEINLFMQTCSKMLPEYYSFFLCAFRTGMRSGELIALHWPDIDWNKKNIKVQRSFRRGVINKPKNNKTRLVDMSDQLISELKKLYTVRKKESLKQGRGEPFEIIFHRYNDYMDQKFIRRVFKRVLKKAGLREQKLHITRHTYASLLLTAGESPVYVKEQLGHSSIDITVDIYGHLIPSSNRGAVNRLDEMGQSAPYMHPPKIEKPQPVKITANSL